MKRSSIRDAIIILFAVYLLWTQRWDRATAFAVVIIMITVLKEERDDS